MTNPDNANVTPKPVPAPKDNGSANWSGSVPSWPKGSQTAMNVGK